MDIEKTEGETSKTRTSEIELKTHEIATKTVTPLHTVDWYIKWVSSITLIIGMVLASNNMFPWNIIVQAIGHFYFTHQIILQRRVLWHQFESELLHQKSLIVKS